MPKPRKEPITDSYIYAAIGKTGGLGSYDADGHYGTLRINGLASRREAQEYKSSLYRCAHYLARTGAAPVSISLADIERSGVFGEYRITFRVSDKAHAVQHIREEFGPNPRNYPYDPSNRNDPDRYRGG